MAPFLEVFVPDALWLREYFGCAGGACMTAIKLRSDGMLVYSRASRAFHASSAKRTFFLIAVSSVNGGRGGPLMDISP